jgi:hypothetical protein
MTNSIGNDFQVHTQPQSAQILGQNLPLGQNLVSKVLIEKNLYKLLLGLGIERSQAESYIYELVNQYDIRVTVDLINNWEGAVGIPDHCLSGTGTIEERRRDVIAKLSSFGVSTAQQYIDLAAQYGYTITITYPSGSFSPVFDMLFDYPLGGGGGEAGFIFIVTFIGVAPPQNNFDMTFNYIFDDGPYNIVICLFNLIKPANVLILYEFEP